MLAQKKCLRRDVSASTQFGLRHLVIYIVVDTPAIVRPRVNDGGLHKVAAECYIHFKVFLLIGI